MEKYDYQQAIREDIQNWLMNNPEETEGMNNDNFDDYFAEILEKLFLSDSVTGNASGSYTFSTWKAEENICHNTDLLTNAADEYGYNNIPSDWLTSAETADVVIRCYLLPGILNDVLLESIIH